MRFLLQFRGLHTDLRIPEFLACLSTVRRVPESALDINLHPAYAHVTGQPTQAQPKRGDAGAVLYGEIFFFADLISVAEARAVADRAVLLRSVYVPAGHGHDYASCIASIDSPRFAGALAPLRDPVVKPSFRCHVEAFGRSVPVERQLDKIHRFSDALRTFPGRVRMKGPDEELWILEDDFPRLGHGRRDETAAPRQVFLGRRVAAGQACVRDAFSLKRRRYIGPTSMDAELAFVMANMARVRPGDVVVDPFCGTGGVLVACGARGALTIGSDINILTLRGRSRDADVAANFAQYGLPPPLGLLRADALNSPIRPRDKRGGCFDAVVCDPPYGLKEGARVFREDAVDADMKRNHFQGTRRIRFDDFLHGVLDYAADVLVDGGRLVYWLPTTPDYTPDDVPTHAALRLVANGVQPLTQRMSRRLITMARLSDDEAKANEQAAAQTALEQRVHESGEAARRKPAHFDLARKLMRQPERAEDLLLPRDVGPVPTD